MALRKGPNVSQFLRQLNEPQDAATDPDFLLDDQDLSIYTNTEFFDSDLGQNTEFQLQPSKRRSESQALSPEDGAATILSPMEDFSSLDFMTGDFNFSSDFGHSYTSPTITSFSDSIGNLQPIQPNTQAVYSAVPQHPPHNGYAQPVSQKQKPGPSFEEQSRVAAEEDKRRRNTAASARFRIKKKQREQALEKSAKEMTEKVTALEGRISQLETENKWLKNIVIEKNGGSEELLSKLLSDFNSRTQSKSSDEEVSNLKAPTSPEEREAGDSSG